MQQNILIRGLVAVFVSVVYGVHVKCASLEANETNETTMEQPHWLEWMLQYIKQDLVPSQILLTTAFHKEVPLFLMSKIINRIVQNKPTYVVSQIKNVKNKKFFKSLFNVRSLDIPRSTTLFICLHHPLHTLRDTIDTYNSFWNNFTGPTIRPRILMIGLSSGLIGNYETILQKLWDLGYLDFTILEINKINIEQAVLHLLNPFTKEYLQNIYSSKIILFPDKLQDLYGYKVKIGIPTDNEFLPVVLQPSRCAKLNGGLYGNILQNLWTVMNSSIQLYVTRPADSDPSIVNFNCTVPHQFISGALGKGMLDFVGIPFEQTDRPRKCVSYERSNIILSHSFTALIPRMKHRQIKLSTNFAAFAFLSIAVVGLILAIRRIFRFDSPIWNILDIWNTLMGAGVPSTPENLCEKVMVITMFIISVSIWGELVCEMTEFNVHQTELINIATLEELASSKLIPVGRPDIWLFIGRLDEPHIDKITKKLERMSLNECLHQLVMYRNVTFVLLTNEAKLVIDQIVDASNNPVATRLADYLQPLWQVYHFKWNSPYVDRVNAILQHFVESGLINIWNKIQTPDFLEAFKRAGKDVKNLEHVNVETLLIYQLSFIAANGYLFALIAFVYEIIKSRKVKSIQSFRTRLRNFQHCITLVLLRKRQVANSSET